MTTASVDFTQDDFNSVRARKRQHIILTYGREINHKSNDDIPRVIHGPNTNRNEDHKEPIDWNQKIDNKISAMMKEFEQHQEKKINDLENKFQTKLEHMMQKVMNDFKDSMTKVMNSMTAQLERIQTSNLQQFSQMMQPTLTTNHLLTDKKEQYSTSSYMVNII